MRRTTTNVSRNASGVFPATEGSNADAWPPAPQHPLPTLSIQPPEERGGLLTRLVRFARLIAGIESAPARPAAAPPPSSAASLPAEPAPVVHERPSRGFD